MASESPGGPRIVREAAELMAGCPHSAADIERFKRFAPDGNHHEAERIRRFGMAKVVSDGLAGGLPSMRDTYPPYGLPEIYRDPGMDQPGWRPIETLEPPSYIKVSKEKEPFWALQSAYTSKMIVYMLGELESMYEDKAWRPIIDQLSTERMQTYHINTKAPPEEAYARLSGPTDNAIEVMTGLMAVLPEVAKQSEVDSDQETLIAILRAKPTETLLLKLSFLSMGQFRAFLVEAMKKPGDPPKPWGWDFSPDQFQIKRNGDELYLDTADKLRETLVSEYEVVITSEDTPIFPDIKVSKDKKNPLGALTEDHQSILGCPSTELTKAMWADMVAVAEEARIFGPESAVADISTKL